MRIQTKVICVVAFLFFLIASTGMASGPMTCTDLGAVVAALPNIVSSSVTAGVVPAGDPTPATQPRCEVDFTFSSRGGTENGYAPGQMQQIKIRVGLPLSSADGGSGGTANGAWNGRTRNLGGGGCAGSVGGVYSATNLGYVGSSNDTGHSSSLGCGFPFIDDHTWNIGLIEDFIIDGITAQVRMAKAIAGLYYGLAPIRNYWDGCSTGGRQGLALAQNHPDELDGWLIGAPAVFWERFQNAQIWGQVVMKDMGLTPPPSPSTEGPIAAAKLNQATASAVAACDGNDGVVDGIVNDPRTCKFSATANICDTPTAPATNCLTATEAAAIDKIWDGPRNGYGLKIFAGLSKQATLTGMNGRNARETAYWQLRWNRQDATYDWHNVTMTTYPYEAEIGSTSAIGQFTDTMSVNLEAVRDSGKKILMWNGTADGSIFADNALEYYKTVAAHFGHGTPDYGALQSWYRYFQAPGVGHCRGGDGAQPQGLFEAMVNWVENGVAPDTISATGGYMYGTPVPNRSRILCPFPTTAIYKGSGSTEDASNYYCGGNLDTKDTICFGLITPYQAETQNELQAYGKYNPATCNDNSKVPINKGTGNPAVSELFTGYNYFEQDEGTMEVNP